MVKAPQSAYLILKLFFKTRERRSVSILLYKTRKHVIHLKMEMHIKLNLYLGARTTTRDTRFVCDNKKGACTRLKRPSLINFSWPEKSKLWTSNFKELASQWLKCLSRSKSPVKQDCNFSGDDKLGDRDSRSTVFETILQCMLISIPECSHPMTGETEKWGYSASMVALLKNGPRNPEFGESSPWRAHIRATCLSGFSFDTIGHETQYGPFPLFLTTQKTRSRLTAW